MAHNCAAAGSAAELARKCCVLAVGGCCKATAGEQQAERATARGNNRTARSLQLQQIFPPQGALQSMSTAAQNTVPVLSKAHIFYWS